MRDGEQRYVNIDADNAERYISYFTILSCYGVTASNVCINPGNIECYWYFTVLLKYSAKAAPISAASSFFPVCWVRRCGGTVNRAARRRLPVAIALNLGLLFVVSEIMLQNYVAGKFHKILSISGHLRGCTRLNCRIISSQRAVTHGYAALRSNIVDWAGRRRKGVAGWYWLPQAEAG